MADAVKEATRGLQERLRGCKMDLAEALGIVRENEAEIAQLETALSALKQANGAALKRKSVKKVARKQGKRRLSKTGREAISKAAKRRWAKYRKGAKRV